MTGKVRLSPIDEIFLAKLPILSVDFTTVYHCLPTALYFVMILQCSTGVATMGPSGGVSRIFGRRVLSKYIIARDNLATPTFKSRKHAHIMHAFARARESPRTLTEIIT